MDPADQRDFDSHYEYWDKIKGVNGGEMSEKGLTQKCTYYNGRGKCGFFGQEKCVWDNGMVEFPYACGVEARMEEEAMFGGEE